MGQVIEIHRKKSFSLEEARQFIPVLRKWTKAANEEIERLATQLSFSRESQTKSDIEAQIQTVFDAWVEKVQRVGAVAKGMWLVDFDSGEGYYCWRFPETEIEFCHGYDEGFTGRVPIQ